MTSSGDRREDQHEHDALSAFFATRKKNVPPPRNRTRFNAGEHIWLGRHGAERACQALAASHGMPVDPRLFRSIPRLHGREKLDYGELVALSGDLYPSPQALYEEKPARLPWLWEGNDLSDIREVFDGELDWIERRIAGTELEVPYPARNLRQAWNAKYYFELALRNVDHFGWHNIRAYCCHHKAALELAVKAAPDPRDPSFREALFTNAFADHFLTDGFAAGHIRVPRAEIITWAEQQGLSDKVAGSLSKLLHDQDGHVDRHSLHGSGDAQRSDADNGLPVQDCSGVLWSTRCDGQLFIAPGASPAAERPILAVQASVSELLLAWLTKELPPSHYSATALVPFPAAGTPTLIDKFPGEMADDELDRLWKNVDWYAKIPWLAGLERKHIRDLFQALPQIMADFRAAIAKTAAEDPQLTRLMAPGYVEAYRSIA